MKRVRIATDASYRADDGIGMGYVANISHSFRNREEITGQKFVGEKCSSTQAEMKAAAWAVGDVAGKINKNKEEYELVLKTDCQDIVEKYQNGDCKKEPMQELQDYSDQFGHALFLWIPRENNQKADAIAREMLRKGASGEA